MAQYLIYIIKYRLAMFSMLVRASEALYLCSSVAKISMMVGTIIILPWHKQGVSALACGHI